MADFIGIMFQELWNWTVSFTLIGQLAFDAVLVTYLALSRKSK